MSLDLVGVLPVSAVNIGLVAAIQGLGVEIAKLQFDISKLQLSLTALAQFTLNVPIPLPSIAAGLQLHLGALVTNLNPATWVTVGVTANLSLSVDLGLIEAQIGILEGIVAAFEAGLTAPGIGLWSYAGRAASFGTALEAQTARGFGAVAAADNVKAAVIATESPSTWGAFTASFNGGSAATRDTPPTTDEARLTFEGFYGGDKLNTGVARLYARLKLMLDLLNGLKATLLAQLQVSVGLNLPDISLLTDFALDIDLNLVLENLVNFNLDFAAQISGLQADIQVIVDLQAELQLQLSAGGLALWTYDGPAAGLGQGLAAALGEGVPSGSGPDTPSYGVVLACVVPEVWAAFGLIFGGAS